MTKQQLIEAIATSAEHDKKGIGQIVDLLLTEVTKALASGERVDLRGFGSFVPKETKARQGRNPQTREPIQIAATKTVSSSRRRIWNRVLQERPLTGWAQLNEVLYFSLSTAGSQVT